MGEFPAYPGARPYSRADSAQFRGRASEADRLSAAWLANRLTYLCGPAGIGKTSLLVAGVLPNVEGRKPTISVLPVGRINGQPDIGSDIAAASGFTLSAMRYPIAAMPEHNPYSFALLRSWSDASTAAQMASKPIDEFISEHVARDPDKVILAAIDQADDLFTGPPGRQSLRQRFLDQLAAVLRDHPRLHLLVAVRDDCLLQYTEVIGEGVQIWVDRLGVTAAYEAITSARVFADDAVEELIASLRSDTAAAPGVRPAAQAEGGVIEPSLLQIACAGLWASLRQRVSVVSLYELRQHGDVTVSTVLRDYCAATVGTVADMHQIPSDRLRSWLIDTFISGAGELASAPEGQPDTAGVPTTAARALEDRYLLRAHHVPPPNPASAPANVPPRRLAPPLRRYMLLSDRLMEPLRKTEPADGAAIQVDPDPTEYLRAAERARITGERDLASRLADQVLRIAPATSLRLHAETHSLVGDLAYEQGSLDKAEDSYRMAMLLFQACGGQAAVARLLAAIARTYLDRGRIVDALSYMNAAVSRVADATLHENLLWVLQAATHQAAQSPSGTAG